MGLSFGDVGRPLRGRVEWAQPEAEAAPGELWPAPDLALIRLLEPSPVPHGCFWLTERTARVFTDKQVAFFGCTETDVSGRVEYVSGRCTVLGELGRDGLLKLGPQDEFPEGVSGGPVVDLERGEVIGVLKAGRVGRGGGIATSVLQLRQLPLTALSLPGERDDLYQHVIHAHDRHHADQHRDAYTTEPTWTDVQSELRGTERALTPGQRAELLGLLAELPPPVSTSALDEIIVEVGGRSHRGTLPAPRGWRDGLGMLYDVGQGLMELQAVLRYAVHAATAHRPYPALPGAEDALLGWVHSTAAGRAELSRLFRSRLRDQQEARLRARRGVPLIDQATPVVPVPADVWEVPGGAPFGTAPDFPPSAASDTLTGLGIATAPEPYVLLEITPHGWERHLYDWRVCVARSGGELASVDEDYRAKGPGEPPEPLRAALAEAFRRVDRPDRPARLQFAAPYSLLGFPVEAWCLTPDAPALGEQRPVVVRCTDPDPEAEDNEELHEQRLRRWDRLHTGGMAPDILDCADGFPRPLPEPAALTGLAPGTVPVLCRTPAGGGEPAALHRVMASGFNVVLWRREVAGREPGCAAQHRSAARTVTYAGRAGRLPAELWRLRARAGGGDPEAVRSRELALVYADPGESLPGADDFLEAP